MALWKDQYGREQGQSADKESIVKEKEVEKPAVAANQDLSRQPQAVARAVVGDSKESLLAAGLTIEGKIEGTGHVRIAGSFKGDVNV